MNRRSFLAALAGVAAAYDPERLLWVPGVRTISIPKPAPIEWLVCSSWQSVPDIIGDLVDQDGEAQIDARYKGGRYYVTLSNSNRKEHLSLPWVLPSQPPIYVPGWTNTFRRDGGW